MGRPASGFFMAILALPTAGGHINRFILNLYREFYSRARGGLGAMILLLAFRLVGNPV